MNMVNYFKNVKLLFFILNNFLIHSDDIGTKLQDVFKEYSANDLTTIAGKTGSYKPIVTNTIDLIMDEKGNLTEKGTVFKSFIDKELGKEFKRDFTSKKLKETIQAAVIGFPNGQQKPDSQENVGDYKVYYQKYGTDTNMPLVVWFHGNGCSFDNWKWRNNDIDNVLKHVLAIEYPSYVNNNFSNFDEIDKYTTSVAEFLLNYINTKNIKQIVLFSHSFGCNVNTLVYKKLKNKISSNSNDIELKSVLVFPYYNAIDASACVLTNFQTISNCTQTAKGQNIFDKIFSFLPKDVDKTPFIKPFVDEMYKRLFEKTMKNSFETELEFIERVSNNGLILNQSGVKLENIILIKDNVKHCEWKYDTNLNKSKLLSSKDKVTLIDYLTDFSNFKIKDDETTNKNIVILYSNKDNMVGNGGLLIAQSFVLKHIKYNKDFLDPKNDPKHKNLKTMYMAMCYDLDKQDIQAINDLNEIDYFDRQAVNDILNAKGFCQCYNQMKKFEDRNIDSSHMDEIGR